MVRMPGRRQRWQVSTRQRLAGDAGGIGIGVVVDGVVVVVDGSVSVTVGCRRSQAPSMVPTTAVKATSDTRRGDMIFDMVEPLQMGW